MHSIEPVEIPTPIKPGLNEALNELRAEGERSVQGIRLRIDIDRKPVAMGRG